MTFEIDIAKTERGTIIVEANSYGEALQQINLYMLDPSASHLRFEVEDRDWETIGEYSWQ